MKLFIAIIIGLLGMSGANAAAPGSKEWANCVWATDSSAAETWLAGDNPKLQTKPDATELLLGMRMVALCSDSVADELKVNREPKWRKLRSALKKADRDAGVGASSARALICRTTADGKLSLHEFVRQTDTGEIVVHRQYFANFNGQPVKLPQDIRSVPQDGAEISRECSMISSDGTLQPLKDEADA
ncbi:MAG: hypothetical protein V7664_05490 [Qipengyuania sp.]|uniref:hypothetical protein n=1 Tax=Qipengyuania sp. TaxID=2004515 RepID=UPI00300237D4